MRLFRRRAASIGVFVARTVGTVTVAVGAYLIYEVGFDGVAVG